jgi:hypothetical protein
LILQGQPANTNGAAAAVFLLLQRYVLNPDGRNCTLIVDPDGTTCNDRRRCTTDDK